MFVFGWAHRCLTLSLLSTSKNQYLSAKHFQGLLNIEGIWVQHRVSPEPFGLLLWNFHRMLQIHKLPFEPIIMKIVTWPLAAILEAILKIWKMPINNYLMHQNIKYPSTPSIIHKDLFWYYTVSSEINKKKSSWRAYCVRYVIPLDMVSLFLMSAKSNVITNIFLKSILVRKISYSSIYDISMSPEHSEKQNKDLHPL